ncbi:uncharacterized protein LOC124717263 isoform X2 [Schistocerca piceifrons]|uniref:uncharacterized protein LOC124717263 isoform X2 n=1 Tax=Schistocerca piceifrons TaxID=274613 RepID=UPI001F5FE9AF|nr:uncharacterized protein LOC124717263 isoform X2 [Schistocerca piceifrons]
MEGLHESLSGSSSAKEQDERQTASLSAAECEQFRKLQNSTLKKELYTGRCVEPCFEDYQLIGDSLLLRFSEQLLFYKCKTDEYNGARALGLCVSGQTVGELLRRVVSEMYPISKKDTKMDLMKRKLRRVVKELTLRTEKIIVLTLPPVPRLSHKPDHWQRLDDYNTCIKGREKYRNVVVADITSLFLIGPQRCRTDCYELFYSGTRRPDRVHLNRAGLQKIHSFLLQKQLLND